MSFTRTLRAVGGAVVAGALLFGTAPVAAADQVRKDQWPLQAFASEEIWKVSTGKGVTVAVIDDGVYSQHQDLKGNVLAGKDFIDGRSSEPKDGDEHGTAMSGIIAGHGHGVGGKDGVKGLAPDAKILAIRDLGKGNDGFAPSIRYAVDKGASVINISQGGTQSPGEPEAIRYALEHDVLVVAATGNDGRGPDSLPSYPANYPGVVGVGGIKSNGEFWEGSNFGPLVMLTAPAKGIVSAGRGVDRYRKGTGTSDASAYVSAAAALLRAKFPDLTAGQIANRLTKTAGLPDSAKGASLPDQKYGYGFIQPLAALKKDIPAGSKNGPLKMPEGQSSSSAGSDGASPNTPDKENNQAKGDQKEDGMSTVAVVGIAAGVLVVVAVIVIVVAMQRKRGRNGPPPPGGTGGYGSGGGAGFPPPPNPYQQPTPPGSYPPPPSNQPPRQ